MFERILHMDLHEIIDRSRQETFKRVDAMRPSVLRPQRRTASGTAFLSNLCARFFDGALEENIGDVLCTNFADDCQLLIARADRAYHGNFDLLGYTGLQFGDPIDWHIDPVSNRRAPRMHWSQIDPLDANAIGDSKVIWELNRHQWLVHLAQAWRLTRYEGYAEAVVKHLDAWLHENPPGIGINWTSSLEVAFRIISWSWTFALLRGAPSLTDQFLGRVADAIEAHASHVERYLSSYFSPNTHLTGEALGLVYAGAILCDANASERWLTTGARILNEQIQRQVHSDGIYFEQSTCYQQYTVDIYLHFMILGARCGIRLSPVVERNLRRMLDALVALRQPDGSMPAIGDEDGGFLLPLGARKARDCSSTFSTAAVVFNSPVYAWAAGSLAPETLWLLGSRAVDAFRAIEPGQPARTNTVFPQSGLVAMRSGWNESAHTMVFDAGPLGCPYSSGHGHADLLSIQCSVFGKPYIVDPGTYCYTPDRESRNAFRTSGAHSTVIVDHRSQVDPAGPFSWTDRCSAQLMKFAEHAAAVFVVGQHDAYAPVTHRRTIAFVRSKFWIVYDEILGSGKHHVQVRYQFAPMDVQIDGHWVRASRTNKQGLLVRAFSPVHLDTTIEEGFVSASYGVKEPAPRLVYSADAQLPVRIVTLLWPFEV